MIKLRNLALAVASIVFIIPFVAVMVLYQLNATQAALSTETADENLNEIIEDWVSRSVPPEERILTFIVSDRLQGGLLEHSPGTGFWNALFSRLTESVWRQDRDMTLLAGGGPAIDWQAEVLLWEKDKSQRLAALSRQLERAHASGARIRITARGEGTLMALSAVQDVSATAKIDRFIALGDSRETLRGRAIRPRNIRELAAIFLMGQAPLLDLIDENGRWTRVPAGRLMGSLSDADVLKAVASLSQEGGSLAASLERMGLITPSLTGKWKGLYYYPKTVAGKPVKQLPPVEFSASLIQEGSDLKGTITEPNTFENETTPFLRAEIISGSVDQRGRVRFLKKYDGRGGKSDTVEYRGELSPGGMNMRGTWKTSDDTAGTFRMQRKTVP